MREPSAEDLDAAHQLVSSALGERHGSLASQGAQHHDPGLEASTTRQPTPPLDSTANDAVEELPEQSEVVSGQTCRYSVPFSHALTLSANSLQLASD
jgi:hypothetical protein